MVLQEDYEFAAGHDHVHICDVKLRQHHSCQTESYRSAFAYHGEYVVLDCTGCFAVAAEVGLGLEYKLVPH